MTKVRVAYVKIKRGRLFWQPSNAMRRLGFRPKSLGPEGPEAVAEALKLYAAWRAASAEPAPALRYPTGSLGHYFERMKTTAAWRKKKPRTREDYDRAWVHLQDLARVTLTRITVEDCERLADRVQADHGVHERYRTIKVLRAIFADAIYRLKLTGYPSPAKGFLNPQPRGRSAIWLGAEVPRLVAGAEQLGYAGMAIAIRIAWDTLFSPVDVRELTVGQIRHGKGGAFAQTDRAKTGKEAFGHLTAETARKVDLFVNSLGFTLAADSPLVRQRNGHAYRSKDTFGDDFRAVRAHVFPGDTRQFQDLRRSGNVEADAAGADKATMAQLLANTIDRNGALDLTYTPPTVAKARQVAELRLEGRKRLAGELARRQR